MKFLIMTLGFLATFLTQAQEVAVEYDPIIVDCLNLIGSSPSEFVINSDKEMEVILKLRESFPMQYLPPGSSCSKLNGIDFRAYTLIGFIVNVAGCKNPDFNLKFTKDLNTYNVQVNYSNTGQCRAIYTEVFWFLTKKIPQNSVVNFKTSML